MEISKRIASLAAAAALALGAGLPAASRADTKADPTLESNAKCVQQAGTAPSLLAYRLLLNSTAVTRTQKGATSAYVGAVDPGSALKVWGFKPSRLVVVEREGLPSGLVGSMFSADYPLSTASLIDSFKGGLKRKIELVAFNAQGWSALGLEQAGISKEPVYQDRHLMVGQLKDGERIMMCATLADFAAFNK